MTYIQTLKSGDLCYFDSFGGMVPCKAVSITGTSGNASTMQTCILQVTADHSPYRKGEKIETNGIHAVPRKSHYYGECGIGHIRFYLVEVQS